MQILDQKTVSILRKPQNCRKLSKNGWMISENQGNCLWKLSNRQYCFPERVFPIFWLFHDIEADSDESEKYWNLNKFTVGAIFWPFRAEFFQNDFAVIIEYFWKLLANSKGMFCKLELLTQNYALTIFLFLLFFFCIQPPFLLLEKNGS